MLYDVVYIPMVIVNTTGYENILYGTDCKSTY